MASILKVDKLDPQSGTALEIGTSGDTISVPSGATLDISASTLTPPATMPASSAANLTNIPGANITGTIAAVSGANLTSLNATNLGSGTVPTARLGSGSASSSVFLAGDNTWASAGGGKVLKWYGASTTGDISSGTATDWVVAQSITVDAPASTDSKFLLWLCHTPHVNTAAQGGVGSGGANGFRRAISGGATTDQMCNMWIALDADVLANFPASACLYDAPATTSAITYSAIYRSALTGTGDYTFYNHNQTPPGPNNLITLTILEMDGS